MSQDFVNISDNHKTSSMLSQKPLNGPTIPAGLEFLYAACRELYPIQPNPLQVTAVVKFWLGGPDPLDYISMYYNAGDSRLKIPPHWHYVSFGLSDLHGDGRVHEVTEPHFPSGYGFELTMRVRCEQGEKSPPTWPAALMQSLAKYVFQTDSTFCAGDHVSWHSALDKSESRIQHMLICEDPQLGVQNTPFGRVQFVQVVGLTMEELQTAQRWNGCGVLNIMKRFPECGGCWHITDMRRGESIFDIDPSVTEEVESGIEKEGSDLSGVSANINWTLINEEVRFSQSTELVEDFADSPHPSFPSAPANPLREIFRESSFSGAGKEVFHSSQLGGHHQQPHDHSDDLNKDNLNDNNSPPEKSEVLLVQRLPSLHLTINLESGSLLPLALRGRLKHGRHFTFKSPVGAKALTLLTSSVEGGFVSPSGPFAVKGPWLQVLVDEELIDTMSADLAPLTNTSNIIVPVSYEWPSKKLKITVVGDDI